jgi:hypothetical protein
MQYAQLNEDGTYSHQITTSGNVQWDENNFCPASALIKDGKAEQFRIVELYETDAPEIDPMTQSVMRDGGEFVGGRWQYKWRIDALTPEQIAQREAEAIPVSVSMKSARKALILAGIPMATINAAFDAIPDATQKELAKVDWEFSSVVRRDSPLVASMASALGLSSAEVDGLFVAASQIPD